jgi:hypothetical protein
MPKKTSTPARLGDGTPVKVPVSVVTVGAASAAATDMTVAAIMKMEKPKRRRVPPALPGAVEWCCLCADFICVFPPRPSRDAF